MQSNCHPKLVTLYEKGALLNLSAKEYLKATLSPPGLGFSGRRFWYAPIHTPQLFRKGSQRHCEKHARNRARPGGQVGSLRAFHGSHSHRKRTSSAASANFRTLTNNA